MLRVTKLSRDYVVDYYGARYWWNYSNSGRWEVYEAGITANWRSVNDAEVPEPVRLALRLEAVT